MVRAQQLPLSLAVYPDDAIVGADVVARALLISARQVSRLRSLPYLRVSRRIRRYRISDVRAWIASRVRGTAAA